MIKLFTDTSANLPAELIKQHGISVVPFSYTVDGKEARYDSETDFDGAAFYSAMRAGAIVRTSMINTDTFLCYFRQEAVKGNDVMYIGMSGGISGAANAAAAAVRELKAEYPALKFAAIDTFAASLGEGLMVLRAAELIDSGQTFEEIERFILTGRRHMCQFFTVDDLVYLKRGGRISGTAALIGSMLNIKPILKGDDTGHIVMCDKVRGSKRAILNLAEKYGRLVFDRDVRIGIAHADNSEGAARLVELLRERGFGGKCINVCYEPVTGSHVGPGTVALFFYGMHK